MKTFTNRWLAVLAVCVGVLMTACSPLTDLGPAPEWRLITIDGKTVGSAELKGKVVVLDFWATWCPPCVAEIPGYVELQEKYRDAGLVIVGASLDQGGVDMVKKFAAAKKVNYPLALSDDALVEKFGGVEAIPTTFVIDRAGHLRYKKVGAESKESMDAKIASLLK